MVRSSSTTLGTPVHITKGQSRRAYAFHGVGRKTTNTVVEQEAVGLAKVSTRGHDEI